MGYVHRRRDGAEKGWALGFIPVWIGPTYNTVTARSWTPDWLMFVCDLPIPYRIKVTARTNSQRKEVIRNSWRKKYLNYIGWWGIRDTIVRFFVPRIYTLGIIIIFAGAVLDTFGFDKLFERSGTLLVMFALSCVLFTLHNTSSLEVTKRGLEKIHKAEEYYADKLNKLNSDKDYRIYRSRRTLGKATADDSPEDEETKKMRLAIRKQQSRYRNIRARLDDEVRFADGNNQEIFESEFVLAILGTFVAGFGDTYPFEVLGFS